MGDEETMKYGIVGRICSGKDTVCDLLKEHGFVKLKYSGVLKRIFNSVGLKPDNRLAYQELGNALRELFGSDVLSEGIVNQSKSHERVIACGIRTKGEFDYLRANGFKIMGLTADDELRFTRAKERSRFTEDKGLTREEFDRIDNHPAEQEISGLLNQSDILINNNSTINELKKLIIKELGL